MNPDELVARSAEEASRRVQGYVDSLIDRGFSVMYANVYLAYLAHYAFFILAILDLDGSKNKRHRVRPFK